MFHKVSFPILSLLEAQTSGAGVRGREHFCPHLASLHPAKGPLPRQAGAGPHPDPEAVCCGRGRRKSGQAGPEGRALPAPPEPSLLGGPPGAQSWDSALTVRPQPGPGAWGVFTALPGAVRRASPSPTPSTPGMRDHQGTGQTSAASLEPPALDPEASDSLSSPGPHPCQFSQWRLRSREGLPGMLTPHACCGPGLEADPHARGQEPQAQR